MILLSVVLGLISMVAYALANVSSQPLVRRWGPAQVLFLRNLTVCVALGVLSLPGWHHLADGRHVLLALGLGVAGYLPVLAFMHGLRVSRVGIMAPIGATSVLVTVVLAFAVLHTPLRSIQWPAIVLVVVANVAISVNPKDWRNSNVMQLASGVPYALLAAFGWGYFYFGLIYPTRALGPWAAAWLVEVGVTLAAGLHLLISRQAVTFKNALAWPVAGSGLAIAVGTAAFTSGVYYYNVGIVAALSNSTALVSALLAAYFFKEKLSRFEKTVAAAMVVGVIVISLP